MPVITFHRYQFPFTPVSETLERFYKMLNSANYVRDAQVIQSGVQFQSDLDPAVLKDPATKIYEHQVKGAKIFMPDGAELVFHGGLFITQNPAIISELDKIANKTGTMVTTNEVALKRLRAEIQKAADDAALPASEGNVLGDKTIELPGVEQQPARRVI